jgi:hypothetical protein
MTMSDNKRKGQTMDILKSDCDRYVAEWDCEIARLEAALEHAKTERQTWARFAAGDQVDVCAGGMFEACQLVDAGR